MGGGRVGGVFWQESTRQERPFLFFKMLDGGEKGPRDSGWKAFGGSQYTVSGFGIAWSRAGTTFHLFQDRRYGQGRTDLIPTGVFPTPQKLLTSLDGGCDARLLKDGCTG